MRNVNSLVGLSPELRSVLADIGDSGLPVIRGQWFVVDPYKITDAAGGVEGVFANILDAYNACVDGRGDGILVLSGGKTSATNTSYLTATIAWSKYNITVVGVASGNGYYGRARIANKGAISPGTGAVTYPTTTSVLRSDTGSWISDGVTVGAVLSIAGTSSNNSTSVTVTVVTAKTLTFSETRTSETVGYTDVFTPVLVNLMTISGENNAFVNINFTNGCVSTSALGAVSVTASRNHFVNCHFNGGDNTSRSAQTTDYDLTLSASECVFDHCYLGNNNQIRAATNGNLVLGVTTTQLGQNFFNDCHFISYSATTTRGAILVTNAVTLGGWIQFKNCTFVNWNSGAETVIATIIIGATPDNCGILLHNCASAGYAAIGVGAKYASTGPTAGAGTGPIAQGVS